ncbi:MAG TPA: myxococcus cysteine-rich repeat containing protein [bacterium]|nr:myxococcus cysteine-rich repeat containing protein [bacterium]
MSSKGMTALVLLAFALLLVPRGGRASAVYVDRLADDPTEGCSLRSAVDSVNANESRGGCSKIGEGTIDTIRLLPGTYEFEAFYDLFSGFKKEDDANANGDLDLLKSAKVLGAGREDTVLKVLNGTPMRLFHVNPKGEPGVSVEISDLTLEDGTVQEVTGGGGCLLNHKADLKLTRVAVKGCRSADGVAGGIYNVEGNLVIEDATISGNEATLSGGGLLNASGTVAIRRATISGNRTLSARGGGLFNAKGTMTLLNATVSGNTALYTGGGIYNFDGILSLTNDTIAFNQADSSKYMLGGGGGLANTEAGTVRMANTLLAKNKAWSDEEPDCVGSIQSLGHNLLGDLGANGACSMTAAAGDQVGSSGAPVEPKLHPLKKASGGNEVHLLLEGSPALNVADASLCPAEDARGVARPEGDGCDIGAVERAKYELFEMATEFSAPLLSAPPTLKTVEGLVAVRAPRCGDGKKEGAETCDDGNTVGGDGCSAVCQNETIRILDAVKFLSMDRVKPLGKP